MEKAIVKQYRTFTGTVVKSSTNKPAVVSVSRQKLNSKYQKRYTVSRKYHVHDEANTLTVGQVVQFVECRPLSKTKRWRLVVAKAAAKKAPAKKAGSKK